MIDGLSYQSLQPNSTIQTDMIVQWLFPTLTFDRGLNITGWLFQGDDVTATEVSKLVTDNRAPTFTVWKRPLRRYLETGEIIDLKRTDLNSTQASSIHKIKGTYPSLYYFELKEAVVTKSEDTFGIRGLTEILAIHFTNITGGFDGAMILDDVDEFQFIFDHHGPETIIPVPLSQSTVATSFNFLPLVTPIFGELLKLYYHSLMCSWKYC